MRFIKKKNQESHLNTNAVHFLAKSSHLFETSFGVPVVSQLVEVFGLYALHLHLI